IDSLEKADWALKKLKAIQAHDDEIGQVAKNNIDQAIAWRDRELDKNQANREYFEGLLTDYLRDQRLVDKKFKIDTPNGRVSTRKNPAGLAYDEKMVLNSLRNQGMSQYIKVKESIDKVDLKKAGRMVGDKFVMEDGEIIAGITEKPATEKVTFKY
ncbi:host-nuclease inhibitor Gam family protein, partial [Lactiplantibacillus plantarum]